MGDGTHTHTHLNSLALFQGWCVCDKKTTMLTGAIHDVLEHASDGKKGNDDDREKKIPAQGIGLIRCNCRTPTRPDAMSVGLSGECVFPSPSFINRISGQVLRPLASVYCLLRFQLGLCLHVDVVGTHTSSQRIRWSESSKVSSLLIRIQPSSFI